MPIAYKVTDADRQEIIRLHEAGLKDFQIAVHMNLHPNAVRWHIKRAKAGKPPRKLRKVATNK